MKTSTTRDNFAKRLLRNLFVAALWLMLWQLAAAAVGQELLLVPPLKVFIRLIDLVRQPVFWQAVFSSCARIMAGVVLALLFGAVLAGLMSRFSFLSAFLRPALQVIKSTPVASFIILALVWIKSSRLATFSSFLIVLPVVWSNLTQGIKDIDRDLLQMSEAYRFSRFKKIRYLYLPSLLPYFSAACATGIGIGWKAGIAAEVLALPKVSIGKALYDAKIYLEMPDLFCWTAVIVLMSLLLEKAASKLIGRVTLYFAEKMGEEDARG